MKKLLALLFIASTMLISCEQNGVNEPDNPKDAPSFTFMEGTEVNPTIGYEGGELVFSFISNCSWIVEENDDWINISPTSGNQGNHTLAINVAKNTTGEERLSKITILYGVDSQVVINLTQEANDVFETDSEGNYIVEADGGTVAVKVTTNLEYDVLIPDEASAWLSLADTRTVREETLTLTVEENETFDERSAKVILKGSDGEVLQSITIKQKGVDEVFYTDSEGNYIIDASGGFVEVQVTTNLDYKIDISTDALSWISIDDTRAEIKDETLRFIVLSNESYDERSATIKLTNADNDLLQTIIIKQRGVDSFQCESENSYTILASGGQIELQISTNISYSVNIPPDAQHWISINETRSIRNDLVSLLIQANDSENIREAIITLTDKDNHELKVFNIIQKGIVISLAYETSDNSPLVPYKTTGYGDNASLIDNVYDPNTRSGKLIFDSPISKIPDQAFDYCTNLKWIDIPESITSIGAGAFKDCYNIERLTVPSTVTLINPSAFENCTGVLTLYCNIPAGNINEGSVFRTSKFSKIIIGEGMTKIPSLAFRGCSSIESITIPNGVKTIESGAFYNCTNLRTAHIPESTTSIGESAFHNCENMEEVLIRETITNIGYEAFYGCGGKLIIYRDIPSNVFFRANFHEILVGDDVRKIDDWAFNECGKISSIVLGSNIESIGHSAFNGCSSLTEISIPDKVLALNQSTFENCHDLKKITIGSRVEKIDNKCFYNCSSLETITIPSRVNYFGDNVFYGCENLRAFYGESASSDNRCLVFDGELKFFARGGLTKYTVPNDVTTIAENAFAGCSNLLEITIGNEVKSIETDAFYGCGGTLNIDSKIAEINYTSYNNPLSSGWLHGTEFSCINFGENILQIGDYLLYNYTYLTKVSLPNLIEHIGDFSFNNCSSLSIINIPDSILYIGKNSFANCESVNDITIGHNVKELGSNAFLNCGGKLSINRDIPTGVFINSKFTHVYIGDGALYIGDEAFSGCSSLQHITLGSNIESIGMNAFNECTGKLEIRCNIPVAQTKVNGAFVNSHFSSVEILDDVCQIGDYSFYECNKLDTLIIPSTITKFGNLAFYGCSGELNINCDIPDVANANCGVFQGAAFSKIITGDQMSYIGDFAFCGIDKSIDIVISQNVEAIGKYAFQGCRGKLYIDSKFVEVDYFYIDDTYQKCNNFWIQESYFTDITLGDNISQIGAFAFDGCYNIRNITFPKNMLSIGAGAFRNCVGFSNITIPEGVTSIGTSAFSKCTGLSCITIPKSVLKIGTDAFYECTGKLVINCNIQDGNSSTRPLWGAKFTELTIGEDVTAIGNYAFRGLKIQDITIPNSITSIGEYAFSECDNLQSVTIGGGVQTIGDKSFFNCKSLLNVYCKATTPPILGEQSFYESNTVNYSTVYNKIGCKFCVPTESLSRYLEAIMWNDYALEIFGYDFN